MEIAKTPIPFATGKYNGRSAISSLENMKNLYIEVTGANAESPVAAIGTPGLTLFSLIPGVSGVLKMIVVRDRIYAVTALGLWRVNEAGATKIADHIIVGRVSIADDGDIIMYVDGYSAYAYTISNGDFQKVDIRPADNVIWQFGYFAVNKKGTNQWAVSDLDSVNFNPLQFASAEADPDFILGIEGDHQEAWLFGEDSTEVWRISNSQFPYDPIQGAFVQKGISGPNAHVRTDNTIYWIGDDKIVYVANGYQPVRISNNSIEEDFSKVDLSDAFMMTYTEEGHIFVWITAPTLNSSYVYDVYNGLWHERTSLKEGRHVANTMVRYRGKTLVGDFRDGRIYLFDLDNPLDDGDVIERECTLPPLFGEGNRQKNAVFELKAQNFGNLIKQNRTVYAGTTTADTTCVTADSTIVTADGFNPSNKKCKGLPRPDQKPMIGLKCTDNHGQTWTPYDYRPSASKGKQDLRYQWLKLGTYYERSYRLRTTAPFPVIWIGAYVG